MREVIICEDGVHSGNKAESHPGKPVDRALSSTEGRQIHLSNEEWGPRL